jgi:hypothetical protein
MLPPGLPDGLFSNQKSKFGQILEFLAMEDDGIFYGQLVHFTYSFFVIFYGHLVLFVVIGYIFSRFGILYQEQSGNPCSRPLARRDLASQKAPGL